MALYEFFCDACQLKFEQITSSTDEDQGKCPKCSSKQHSKRLISRFAVGGQGDLRESTFHGCHDHFTGAETSSSSDSGGGHVHGPGCGHGGSGHSHD